MILPSLYAAATTLAAPGLRVMLKRRAARGKEFFPRLGERRGIDASIRPGGKLVWLHAASVGETMSVLPLLPRLDARVLLTTGTVTSAKLLAQLLPELGLAERVMHRFVPLDVPAWAERFLDHWRPDAAGFVESEIWPNLLVRCAAHRVPLMLVNARLSERSFSHWKFFPGFARRLFGFFSVVQAQSEADAERVQALGGPRSALTGNLKYAADPLPVDAAELQRLRRLLGERPVWLAASTHPSEDPIVLAVHAKLAVRHPGLLTIIVPRHPDRGPAIAAQATVPTARRSLGEAPPADAGVWVADTLGELGLFYRLGGTVFVGKSLGSERGGQNVLEPARLRCAIAVGPEVQNFAEPVAVLEAAGALERVADADALARWVEAMLSDPARRAAMAEAGIAAASRFSELPRQVAGLLTALLR